MSFYKTVFNREVTYRIWSFLHTNKKTFIC